MCGDVLARPDTRRGEILRLQYRIDDRVGRQPGLNQLSPDPADARLGDLVEIDMAGIVEPEQASGEIAMDLPEGAVDRGEPADQAVCVRQSDMMQQIGDPQRVHPRQAAGDSAFPRQRTAGKPRSGSSADEWNAMFVGKAYDFDYVGCVTRECDAIGPRHFHRAVVLIQGQIFGFVQHAVCAEEFFEVSQESSVHFGPRLFRSRLAPL